MAEGTVDVQLALGSGDASAYLDLAAVHLLISHFCDYLKRGELVLQDCDDLIRHSNGKDMILGGCKATLFLLVTVVLDQPV